jgi:uncharacterized protein
MVCERHVGVGITVAEIKRRRLPLPERDMRPVSIEEQIICFADKFFSKTQVRSGEKSVTEIKRGLARYGPEQVAQFESWVRFLGT